MPFGIFVCERGSCERWTRSKMAALSISELRNISIYVSGEVLLPLLYRVSLRHILDRKFPRSFVEYSYAK